jgi:hypothetical protein
VTAGASHGGRRGEGEDDAVRRWLRTGVRDGEGNVATGGLGLVEMGA